MNEFTIAFLLAALLGSPIQDSTLEDRAVNRVQQAPASQYDPTLPSRPFGNWLNQVVGPQSGVSWRLGECDEVKKLKIVRLPQIRINGAPKLYFGKAPDLFDLSENMPFETVDEPPPPKPVPVQRVSKVATASNALTKVAPTYPPVAKYGRITGAVQAPITIDEKGRVIEAKAISGHVTLRSAAEEAARKWVFRPAILDGKAIRQEDVLTFNFSLPQ